MPGFASKKIFSYILDGIYNVIFRRFWVIDTLEILKDRKSTENEIRQVIIPNKFIRDNVLINKDLCCEFIGEFIQFPFDIDSVDNQTQKIMQGEAKKYPYIDGQSPEEKADKSDSSLVRMTGHGIFLFISGHMFRSQTLMKHLYSNLIYYRL